jgi:hypothetical protein
LGIFETSDMRVKRISERGAHNYFPLTNKVKIAKTRTVKMGGA